MLKRHLNILLFVACVLCAQAVFAQTTTVEPIEQTWCIEQSVNILKTEHIQLTDNQTYIWIKEQNGQKDTLPENGWQIIVTETQDATYTCHLISTEVKAENNLMANGDFETIEGEIGTNTPVPSTFSSSYNFAGWDPEQYFASGKPRPAGNSNLYAITHDATYFWKDFATVKPHGGKYFALFDAGKSGDAWRATTKENTALVLEKDSVYLFSYWAAHPNIPQYSNSPAIFQFVIKCKNSANKDYVEHKLGEEYKLDGKHNNWVYQEVRWKAPMSADSVIISVHDCNDNDGTGNDFCLDDIMFQKTTYIEKTIIKTYIFHLKVCPCPELKDSIRELTVCDTLMPYTWEGHEFTQADTYSYIEQSPRGCDSIRHVLRLYVEKCCPTPIIEPDSLTICSNELPYTWHNILFTAAADSVIPDYNERGCDSVYYELQLTVRQGVEMYAKWTDVIFVRNIDSLYTAYQWYQNGQPIDGATEQFYHDPNGLTGRYHCVMQTRNGGSEETCPAAFQDLDRSAEHNPGDAPKQLVAQRTYNIGTHLQIIISVFDDNSTTAEKYWKE